MSGEGTVLALRRGGAVVQGDGGVPSLATLNQIIAQSIGTNVLKPDGVPSYFDWYNQGRPNSGGVGTAGGYTHVVAWPQPYMPAGAPYNPDYLTKLGTAAMYWHSSATDQWTKFGGAARPSLAYYLADFATNANLPIPEYSVAPNPRIAPFIKGYATKYNQHGFAGSRVAIPANIDALLVVFEAKLISRSGADLSGLGANGPLISVGADYWTDVSAGTNRDVMVGSFTQLTTNLRKFYALVAPEMSIVWLRAHPLPSDVEQYTQTDSLAIDPQLVDPIPAPTGSENLASPRDFSNSSNWFKNNVATVDANAQTSADGTTNADRINVTSSVSAGYMRSNTVNPPISVGAKVVVKFDFKRDSGTKYPYMQLRQQDAGSTNQADSVMFFNPDTLAVQQVDFTSTMTAVNVIEPLGDGWYRCHSTITGVTNATKVSPQFGFADAMGNRSVTAGSAFYDNASGKAL